MKKKELINILKRLDGDPEIGINVLFKNGSELIALDRRNFKAMDKGATFALAQVRERDVIPFYEIKHLTALPVLSSDCSAGSVKDRLSARYEIVLPDEAETAKMDTESTLMTVMSVLLSDLEELIKLKDDFIALSQATMPELKKYRTEVKDA